MVSAVSSQAATLNPLAYLAQTDDDTTNQAAPDATANDSDRGPATQVSLSQDAMDALQTSTADRFASAKANMETAQGEGEAAMMNAQAAMEAAKRRGELAKINSQLSLFDQQDAMRDTNEAAMKRLQASHDKWLSSPTSPEVALNADDTAKALKMLKNAGRTLPALGPNTTYGFVKDGIQYNFHGDGTVTTRKEGIPTSEEDRQKGFASYSTMMDIFADQLRDNTEARANLTAQRDALMALQPQ